MLRRCGETVRRSSHSEQLLPLGPERRRRPASPWWLHLILAFAVIGVVLTFVAKPYLVPSSSMEPTLMPGERILVDRVDEAFSDPHRGDVVVFDAGQSWDVPAVVGGNVVSRILRWIGEASGFGPSGAHTLVKRVIGLPGDGVSCCTSSGAVIVDGDALDEPYVTNDLPFVRGELDCRTVPRSQRCFSPITVPAHSYLVLGDNRADSADSVVRCRTPGAADDCARWVERGDIVGRAAVVLWPPFAARPVH